MTWVVVPENYLFPIPIEQIALQTISTASSTIESIRRRGPGVPHTVVCWWAGIFPETEDILSADYSLSATLRALEELHVCCMGCSSGLEPM